MTLNHAKPGKYYKITTIEGTPADCRHLYTLGFTPQEDIHCLLTAPQGDPIAFSVQGTVIALRKSQLKHIHALAKEGGAWV